MSNGDFDFLPVFYNKIDGIYNKLFKNVLVKNLRFAP